MSGARAPDFASEALPGARMHAVLAALRRADGPLARVAFGGRPAFVTTTFALLREGFLDVERLPPARLYQRTLARVIGPNFQSMEGEPHRIYRRLATPAFRSRAVERFAEREIPGLAHEVLDGLAGGSPVDLVERFTHRLPFLVISRLLGVPREREAAFHRWAWEMLGPPGVRREVSRRAASEFARYLVPTLAARRREPRDDVVSELVHSEVEGRRLDDDEVLSHVRLMFSAGAMTTHDALGNLIHTLLTQGDLWKQVVEEASLRPGAIHELLRWEPPVANLPRISADAPVEFGGREIPPESTVLFSMAAAGRDPAVCDEPDRYDPRRPRSDVLSFGRGERACPGMHLAQQGLRFGLDALAERFPGLRLLGDPARSAPSGATVRGPDRLPVALG